MKPLGKIICVAILASLTGCNLTIPKPDQPNPTKPIGLLEVTVTGIGDGATPSATARWVQRVQPGISGQTATVVRVNGNNALNDVQLIRRAVSFYHNDLTSTRFVVATFDLINRTTVHFNNFTLYAVHTPSNLGGTGVVSMTSGTGAAITDANIARGFKPTHGMRPTLQSLEVNPILADLQFFTPSEVDNPSNGIKQQAIASNILTAADTVLEYGFVARNYSGGRAIAARNTPLDCTINACKGTFSLAYQSPKVNPRQNNPFSFSLYFVVANESVTMGSQSLEEQDSNTVMGLSNPVGFAQLRTVVGGYFQEDQMVPLCRVRMAIAPNLYLGQDPIPTASGSLDVCFGADGKRVTSLGSGYQEARSVALQSDGKIVVAGAGNSNLGSDFALVRYNPDGTLDTTFDNDGKVLTDFSLENDHARSMAIQGDGKIVVAGFSYTSSSNSNDFGLARYNLDGSLDTTFDWDGKAIADFGSIYDFAESMAIQPDGKIVVAGYTEGVGNADFALARFTPSGWLDTSFDTDGKVTTDFGSNLDRAHALALQSDGKIVVAGESYNGNGIGGFALARYNANGSLDTSFGGDGTVITGSGPAQTFSLAIQPDGKIVVAGQSYNGLNNDFALVRYNPDGSLDTSFDTDGIAITDFGSFDIGTSLTIQSNGKMVVAGYSNTGLTNEFAVARYNTNGSLDTSFDGDGKVTTAIGSPDLAYSVAIQPDGKIVVAGLSYFTNQYTFALARYNP